MFPSVPSRPAPPAAPSAATAGLARIAAVALVLTMAVGEAAAHPGHGGASSEPETWLVVAPLFLGFVATATTAGLRREGMISGRWALAGVACGVCLLVVGAVLWVS